MPEVNGSPSQSVLYDDYDPRVLTDRQFAVLQKHLGDDTQAWQDFKDYRYGLEERGISCREQVVSGGIPYDEAVTQFDLVEEKMSSYQSSSAIVGFYINYTLGIGEAGRLKREMKPWMNDLWSNNLGSSFSYGRSHMGMLQDLNEIHKTYTGIPPIVVGVRVMRGKCLPGSSPNFESAYQMLTEEIDKKIGK